MQVEGFYGDSNCPADAGIFFCGDEVYVEFAEKAFRGTYFEVEAFCFARAGDDEAEH